MSTSERRCQRTKADGSPCGAPPELVDPEMGLCPAHSEGGRERLREAGRKGAEARHGRGGSAGASEPDGLRPEELPPLEDHGDAKLWLEALGRAVATGRLKERAAQAAIRAVSEWVSAHEGELTARVVGELEEEVERLRGELEGSAPRLRSMP